MDVQPVHVTVAHKIPLQAQDVSTSIDSVSLLLNLNFTVRASFMEYLFVFCPFVSTIVVAIVILSSTKITAIGN